MPESANASVVPAAVRCAIYTRKSSEMGLEQDFNSLHAQREAAEAYILSQRQQGWVALPDQYDDGGSTGGNMERPGLRKLMAAIEAGRIDCVVVYKVDRLSRPLLDFARMIGAFEKHGVSFVSITQQFNTSTPVGRLTLNILLSFAQFEREIISERTRDKQWAARKKGKWTGGYLVLGYDLDARRKRLVVNAREARQVRALFQLVAKHGSLEGALSEAKRRGWRTKTWVTHQKKRHPGGALGEGSLLRLLRNPIYKGCVHHQGKLYPGEHTAIVDPALWEQANTRIPDRAAAEVKKRIGKQSGDVFESRGRLRSPATPPTKGRAVRPALPRITHLMALAIKLEGMLRDDTMQDYSEVARLGHVSRARVSQIMSLLQLAPDLQEELLFLTSAERGREGITEPLLRKVVRQYNWDEQRRMFRQKRRCSDGQ